MKKKDDKVHWAVWVLLGLATAVFVALFVWLHYMSKAGV